MEILEITNLVDELRKYQELRDLVHSFQRSLESKKGLFDPANIIPAVNAFKDVEIQGHIFRITRKLEGKQ